jgi:hypothetical protein
MELSFADVDAKYFPSFEKERLEIMEVWPIRRFRRPRRSQIDNKYGDELAPHARKEPQGENFKNPVVPFCPSLNFVLGHGGVIPMPAS